MNLQQPTSAVDTVEESDGLSEQPSYYDDEDKRISLYSRKEQEKRRKYERLPDVTLSSLTETGQDESTIPVLKQRSYTGKGFVPSALANTLCADLGVYGVLEELNNTLGTSYTLDSVLPVLDSYVAQNCDFGTAYASLRPYWSDIHTIEHKLCIREQEDREMRRNVLIHDRITSPNVRPRRVWDLYANRVVPYWVAGTYPWGISRAWVNEKDRVNVMTPINGYEWPVPIPKDASLDLIRIEMLNLGAKYAWLDVLCLRQEGGKSEHLRLDEWMLDVPTIGWVYATRATYAHHQLIRVVCYFNGLGRPLDLTLDDFKSDRCWFRRAWTLQEITPNPIIGGETVNDVMDKEVRRRFDEKLTSLREIRKLDMTLEILSEMRNRVSTKPLDRVAGLVYLVMTDSIPIYDAEQSEADAWEVLMDAMEPRNRAELLFYYPEPGNGKKSWRPSWQQVMMDKDIVFCSSRLSGKVYRTEGLDADWYPGYHIKSGDVRGLTEARMREASRRRASHQGRQQGTPYTKNCGRPCIPNTRWVVYTHRLRRQVFN
ncbi:hypothetical protein EV421DRAFT_2089860 [Armillaria borealis]|uniref:Heterokaryon incompatibility domain-containing protein n=1 Tax=Armillaria borealis TaxID=47425 RepID=A0AA39MFD1_9AGAR|nr:hypothetical protein EV421DRAFT_2089860 [Armillaria borealis]